MSRPARSWDDGEEEGVPDLEEARDDSLRIAVGETAAQMPAYAPPARRRAPAPAPAPRPRRRVRWGQLATVGLLGYLVVMGVSSEMTYLKVAHQSAALSRQIAIVTTQNRSLQHQITLLHQRRYVDELARTQLGYTSPGEVELVPRTKP